MSIISLSQAIEKRNAPDAGCTTQAMDGSPLYRFSLAYGMNGRQFSFDIWARDWQDAEAHCRAIREGAEVDGQIVGVR